LGRDAAIVDRAHRIHPAVAHGAARVATVAVASRWDALAGSAATDETYYATRSIALGDAALSAPARTMETTLPPLAVADSLHAIALSYLAEACSTLHASVSHTVLDTLSARTRSAAPFEPIAAVGA
jgi:hypothetical protein